MTVSTVELFFALLALLAVGAMVTLGIVRLLAIWSPAARGWYRSIGTLIVPNAIGMAPV